MKKKFDSVELMRTAREKLTQEWQDRPRSEEIQHLRDKYGKLRGRGKKRAAS